MTATVPPPIAAIRWLVRPAPGRQPADARGGDAMDVVDAGLDATLDVGADGDVEADASQDADLVDGPTSPTRCRVRRVDRTKAASAIRRSPPAPRASSLARG
ncbi:MAG: hypothetical protein R3F43_03525 [bacterium]